MFLVVLFIRVSNYLSGQPPVDVDREEQAMLKQSREERSIEQAMPVYRKLEVLAMSRVEDEKHP